MDSDVALEIKQSVGPQYKECKINQVAALDHEIISIGIIGNSSELNSWCRNLHSDYNEVNQDIEMLSQVQCQICLDSYFHDAFINPLGCHEFCKNCLISYLKDQVRRAKVFDIKCPQNNCMNSFHDIETFVNDEEVIKKYKYFQNRQTLEKDPLIRFCPKFRCDKYVRFDGIAKIIQCECGTQICVDCHLEAHPGRSCKELQIKLDSSVIRQFKIHKCPNCNALVQKISGCNMMVCNKCHHSFCWICFGDPEKSHYDFLNIFGCPFGDTQHMNIEPLRYPMLIRCLIAIPKFILIILLFALFLVLYPFLAIWIALVEIPQKMDCIKKQHFKWWVIPIIGLPMLPFTLPVAVLVIPFLLFYWIAMRNYDDG